MKNNKDTNQNNLAMGISVGMCLGVAIGTAMNNIAIGISIGLCLGVAMGSAFEKKDKE